MVEWRICIHNISEAYCLLVYGKPFIKEIFEGHSHKTMFTSFDQDTCTATFYDNHILLTMICIFWPEFVLKPRLLPHWIWIYISQLLPVTQGCVMNLTRGYITKVKVTVHK